MTFCRWRRSSRCREANTFMKRPTLIPVLRNRPALCNTVKPRSFLLLKHARLRCFYQLSLECAAPAAPAACTHAHSCILADFSISPSVGVGCGNMATMKVPIDTLPVELRIHIYEYGDVCGVFSVHEFPWSRTIPWQRTIVMSGILNDKDAIEIAALQGDETRSFMCELIAISGNIPMIKWARSEKSSRQNDTADEPSSKQIRLTPFPWSTTACYHAASFGHLKMLKWLHEQGCPWNYWTFSGAAAFGNIEILEWLYEKKCPWNEWTFSEAAKSGNFDVLKWLHERKCPWDKNANTFVTAVSTGNLDIVQWMHEHKCPWNEGVCAQAAARGYLNILVWLRERGCPWDKRTLSSAVEFGHNDLHSWAIENGCPNYYKYMFF